MGSQKGNKGVVVVDHTQNPGGRKVTKQFLISNGVRFSQKEGRAFHDGRNKIPNIGSRSDFIAKRHDRIVNSAKGRKTIANSRNKDTSQKDTDQAYKGTG